MVGAMQPHPLFRQIGWPFCARPACAMGAMAGKSGLIVRVLQGQMPLCFQVQGPATLISAIGHLGQYVIASPDQGTVLVRLGKTNDPDLGPVRTGLGQIMSSIPVKKAANAQP